MTDKFGTSRVCQIANFNYETPLTAIQNAGRILSIPIKEVNKIAEYFKQKTFADCLAITPDIYDKFPMYTEVIDIAKLFSGRVRGVSAHAGGLCICPTDLRDYYSCKPNNDGEYVLEVDKKFVEAIGLVKYDALGVEALNVIKEAVESSGITLWDIDINNPEFENDKAAYDLICSCNTEAVFQFESAGMKSLLERIQPRNLHELADINALIRPDAAASIEPYIEGKYNPQTINYIHEDLKPILQGTNGQMIYQEQLMNIVRQFGGRSYGGSDIYRKAIGKKIPELVKSETEKLFQEILDNGYSDEVAHYFCDRLKEAGGYLFNSSHAYSYAVLALQTAYLKAHYPVHYMKALFNSVKDDSSKLNKYLINAKEMEIQILPPNINESDMYFTTDGKTILFGLSAITAIGNKLAQEIINERNANGKFKNMNDLLMRVKLNKTQIIMLIKAGAIPTKDKYTTLMKYCYSLFTKREYKPVKTIGCSIAELRDKYGITTKDKQERLQLYNVVKEQVFIQEQQEKLNKHIAEFQEQYMRDIDYWEFESLSMFINNNPFEAAYEYIRPIEDIEDGAEAVIVGIISKVQKKKDKHGKTFCYMNMYSAFGIVEVLLWHSQYTKFNDLIFKGNSVAILCTKNEGSTPICKDLKPYEEWSKEVLVRLRGENYGSGA